MHHYEQNGELARNRRSVVAGQFGLLKRPDDQSAISYFDFDILEYN